MGITLINSLTWQSLSFIALRLSSKKRQACTPKPVHSPFAVMSRQRIHRRDPHLFNVCIIILHRDQHQPWGSLFIRRDRDQNYLRYLPSPHSPPFRSA
jgi:hypothetical protein